MFFFAFNVITLTSTCVAFVVGTGINILGRRGGETIKKAYRLEKEKLKGADIDPSEFEDEGGGLLTKLIRKFKKSFKRKEVVIIKEEAEEEEEEEEDEEEGEEEEEAEEEESDYSDSDGEEAPKNPTN